MNIQLPPFDGPLFLTGMPRSGTKLLRDLLNNHSKIAIPVQESHMIPWLLGKFGLDYDLRQDDKLENALEAFRSTKFYHCYPEKAGEITLEKMKAKKTVAGWKDFFEYILRLYAESTPGSWFIWGDKTPGYIIHYGLLQQAFPGIRIIHIIRDPRDYSWSVHNAWGKSMLRAAHRWQEAMKKVGQFEKSPDNYLEIRYEDLIERPEEILAQACRFAGLLPEPGMGRLSRKTENLGETQGSMKVVSTNKNKFLQKIPPARLRRIEELVCEQAQHLSYEMVNQVQFKPLSRRELRLLKLSDGFRSALHHVKDKGVKNGLWYFIKHHQHRSWLRINGKKFNEQTP